ncbi:MAG: methyl-accepting chemotaxis protein [Ignavibacteria bacterium]|jgi:hypothetical protein
MISLKNLSIFGKFIGLSVILLMLTLLVAYFSQLKTITFDERDDARMLENYLLKARNYETFSLTTRNIEFADSVESLCLEFQNVSQNYSDGLFVTLTKQITNFRDAFMDAVKNKKLRKLAERTSKATKEISLTIQKIQGDTYEAVKGIQLGAKEVKRGKELANKAGETLTNILNATKKVEINIEEVAAAAEEQSRASQQIRENIKQIENVSLQSAESVAQVAMSGSHLESSTERLLNDICRFKIDNNKRIENSEIRILKSTV